MKYQLTQSLFKTIEMAEAVGKTSVVIEAGHFYADRGVDADILEGVHFAMSVLGIIQDEITVEKMTFVDDIGYHSSGEHETETIRDGLSAIASLGFVPDQIIFESHLTSVAEGEISRLLSHGKAKSIYPKTDRGGRDCNSAGREAKVMLKRGWIPLTGKAGMNAHPSCAMLDAVLYQQKLVRHGGAITILTEKGADQQQRDTAEILAAMEMAKPNVLTVFLGSQRSGSAAIKHWGFHE